MPDQLQTKPEKNPERFIPRRLEMAALMSALPVEGTEQNSKRVFNIWGEDGVGKSTFISEFRESETMSKAKVLWLQPTRNGKLDTIPEFIRACAETIRYPTAARKENKIAERLEAVQRGKVNPIVSDDSLLITRSTVVNKKKPHINQAAAASVGRTEVVRDDVEVNVGLGESKASNHAEAFLDALPLKSLGTDLTIIFIEKFEDLSVSIIDWLRDYVFPAATAGAYRRSIVLLLESRDPVELAFPNEDWGVWSDKTENFQLYPYSQDDTYSYAIHCGLEPEVAKFLHYKSLGYPKETHQAIKELKALDRSRAIKLLDGLPAPDQLKIAALSIPQTIHQKDLPILFGKKASTEIFKWFKELPNTDTILRSDGDELALSDSLRVEAFRRFRDSDELKAFSKDWAPMARITHCIPERADRSKLLLLSAIHWIDEPFCQKLFGDQSKKVIPFITEENSPYFNRKLDRFRISERIRPALQKVALSLGHPGMSIVKQKAEHIWNTRCEALTQTLAKLETRREELQNEIQKQSSRHKEVHTQLRIRERANSSSVSKSYKPGFFAKLLSFGDSEEIDANSPEGLRKISSKITVTISELEQKLDALENEEQSIRNELAYPSVQQASEPQL